MARGYRVALLALLGLELATMAWLVLSPSPAVPNSSVAAVSRWLIEHGVGNWEQVPGKVEFGLNVLLFAPLGLTAALIFARVPWLSWPVVGFVGALGVELAQRDFLSARQADWYDVCANTVGMAIGAAAGAMLRVVVKWRSRSEIGHTGTLRISARRS